ncbi:hypothetical protein ACHAXS_008719, partial [Conticribra weissflogii]
MNYFSRHFHNEFYSDRNASSLEAERPADVEYGIMAVNIPLLCDEPTQDCHSEDRDQAASEEPPCSTTPKPLAVFNSAKSDSGLSTTNQGVANGELHCTSDLPGALVVAGSHDNEVEQGKHGSSDEYRMATDATIDANAYFSRHSRNGNSCSEGHSTVTGERLNSGEDLSREENVHLVSVESIRDHQIDELDRYGSEIIDRPHDSAMRLPPSEIECVNNFPLRLQNESNDVGEESPKECINGIQGLLRSRELRRIPESSEEAIGPSYNAKPCAYRPKIIQNAANVAPYHSHQIHNNFRSVDGAGNQLNLEDALLKNNIPLASTEWNADYQINKIHPRGLGSSRVTDSSVIVRPVIDSNFANETIAQSLSKEECLRDHNDMIQINEDLQKINETTMQAEVVANDDSIFNHSAETKIKANAVSYFRRHTNNAFESDGSSLRRIDVQLNTVDDFVNETMAHGESIGHHHHEPTAGSGCSAIIPEKSPAEVTSASIDSASRYAPPNHAEQQLPVECTDALQGLPCLRVNGFRDHHYTSVWSEAAWNTDPYIFFYEQALGTTTIETTANTSYQLHHFFNKFYSSRNSPYLTSGEGRSMNLGDEIVRENIRMASGDWIRYIPNESNPQLDNNSYRIGFSPSRPNELTSTNDTAAISLLQLAQIEEHQQLQLQTKNNDNADEVRDIPVESDFKDLPSAIAPASSETTATQAHVDIDESNDKHYVPDVNERCSLLHVTKPEIQTHDAPKPKRTTKLSGPEIEKPHAPSVTSESLPADESYIYNLPTEPPAPKLKNYLRNENILMKIESEREKTLLSPNPEYHNGKNGQQSASTSLIDSQKSSAKPKRAKKRPKRVIDESRVCEPTDNDILFGRGGFTNTHPGNVKFREEALKLRDWYESATKEEKYTISDLL